MLSLTKKAAKKVQYIINDNEFDLSEAGVKLSVKAGGCSGFEYYLDVIEAPEDSDRIFESQGLNIFCDPKSYLYVRGTVIDYEEGSMTSGFSFENPNAKRSCGCGTSFLA